MTPGSIANVAVALGAILIAAPVQAAAAEHYVAKLAPLNADKIGTSASGTANLEIVDGKLNVTIDLAGLSPNLMHLQHYHGFIDGKDATCPTAASDANGDGYIDLVETEPTSGTTMLPFHAHPATLEIANDTYPVADKSGAAHYTHTDDVAALDKALKREVESHGPRIIQARHRRSRRSKRRETSRLREISSGRPGAGDHSRSLRKDRSSQITRLRQELL